MNLAKISDDDCNLIEGLMTRYSVYEYSQSSERLDTPPETETIETDLKALIAWIDEFTARKK